MDEVKFKVLEDIKWVFSSEEDEDSPEVWEAICKLWEMDAKGIEKFIENKGKDIEEFTDEELQELADSGLFGDVLNQE